MRTVQSFGIYVFARDPPPVPLKVIQLSNVVQRLVIMSMDPGAKGMSYRVWAVVFVFDGQRTGPSSNPNVSHPNIETSCKSAECSVAVTISLPASLLFIVNVGQLRTATACCA